MQHAVRPVLMMRGWCRYAISWTKKDSSLLYDTYRCPFSLVCLRARFLACFLVAARQR
jgi:hypothetical protein